MSKPTLPATRSTRLATVNAHDLKVNPVAQRDFKHSWAEHILANFDINKFQRPHVNKRTDGTLYVLEGQHGTWAYREKFAVEGESNLPIQVELYDGLTEAEEAEYFLSLNDKKVVDAYSKFKVAVTAGRAVESDIDRIVRVNRCRVTSMTTQEGAISAVTALIQIYNRAGAANLSATIRILRDSFGDGGYDRANLLGLSAVIARYNLTDLDLVAALIKIPRGSKGLAQQAALNRQTFGCTIVEATAAALVDAYNKGKRGRAKVPSWWTAGEEAAA